MSLPVVLAIQAVDPVGAEGLGGDLRVLADLDCAARIVATGVVLPPPHGRHRLPDDVLEAQIRGAFLERPPAVVRTGTFVDPAQAERVGACLREAHPPMVVVAYEPGSRAGDFRRATVEALRESLVPLSRVLVLRAGLAEDWFGEACEDLDGARRGAAGLVEGGAIGVLVTGVFSGGRVLDVLVDGERTAVFDTPRIAATRVDGLAVAHASALAAHLAHGLPLERAAAAAQRYVAARLSAGR